MTDADTLRDVWDNPARKWPSIVYVETTNACNARCLCCTNRLMKRPRRIMSNDVFRQVADKVKARGLKIGALFCSGEPLLDPGIFEKYAYAHALNLLTPHVGLNTNVSTLTEDKWADVLAYTPNITLSFFNVEGEFERLTGGLSWDDCYTKARRFIAFRDKVAPQYPIFIGCNRVKGSDFDAVKRAFWGCNVQFVEDGEITYGEGAYYDGVCSRTIMFPDWRCDGFKGALQIKPNADTEFCAYDIPGTDAGVGETRFGNFLTDDWETLERNFRATWRAGCVACLKCDYWYLARRVIANGCCPLEDMSWPRPPPNGPAGGQ